MSELKTLRILVVLCSIVYPSVSFGGFGAHGGDNQHPAKGTAWFLGANKTVRYCLVSSNGFNVDHKNLKKAVSNAISTWRHYMRKRLPFSKINERFSHRAYTLSFKFQPQCSNESDLRIYFGVSDSEVLRQKKLFFDPIAFSHRESFDQEAGWSRGFIWVSNPSQTKVYLGQGKSKKIEIDWNDKGSLEGILLHELGHVFGVAHVENTIMTQKIIQKLFAHKIHSDTCKKPSSFLTKIDDTRELVPCFDCLNKPKGLSWVGDINVKDFEAHADRKSRGKLTAKFSLLPDLPRSDIFVMQIDASDDLGSISWNLASNIIPPIPLSSYLSRNQNIFKTYFIEGSQYGVSSFSQYRKEWAVADYIGRIVSAQYNFNKNQSPLVVTLLENEIFRVRSSFDEGCHVRNSRPDQFWQVDGLKPLP